MGMLRLLLALAVVIEHADFRKHLLLDGVKAVETFFMISGFYMALILREKYSGPGSYRLFISNRFLRIYPTYWAVLILSVISFAILTHTAHRPGPLVIYKTPHLGIAFWLLHLANILILGMDLFLFAGVSGHGHLILSTDITPFTPRLTNFLIISPAWSLSLELTFYLIAPLLTKASNRALIALLAASLALRIYLYSVLHLQNDPWNYRFFPTEMVFFLAGILAYRVYLHIRANDWSKRGLFVASIAFLVLASTFNLLPEFRFARWTFFIAAWAAIPALFATFKNIRWDREIGELSYPVYIVHFLIISILTPILAHTRFHDGWIFIALVIVLTIITSLLIGRLLIEPIERFRQRRAAKMLASQHPSPTLDEVASVPESGQRPAITPN